MRKIILASQSPRRKELLAAMGLDFEAVPSNFDEKLDDNRAPEVVATELAVGKASAVAAKYPDCIIIGSDTIVAIGGKQLDKPHDTTDNLRMLKSLSGMYHDVTTSLAVVCKVEDILLTAVDTTRVYFKPYDAAIVETYADSGDGLDKAGGYGIQSGAALLIDHIEGHYDTVIGLPTHALFYLLAQLGVPAKPAELIPPVKQLFKVAA